jgi:hypothetical protein
MPNPVTGTGTTGTIQTLPTPPNQIVTAAFLNVGPGSNPPAYAPSGEIPVGEPDSTKGNVAGVWGYAGPFSKVASVQNPINQTASPPITCAVYGEGGVVGVNGFTGTPQASDEAPDGAGVLGYGGTHGVNGISNTGNGVRGTSDSGNGVSGVSNSGNGVEGTSTSNFGVYGTSTSGIGVHGQSLGSGLAGQFDGNVKVNGDITAVNTVTVNVDVVLTGADCAEQFDMRDAQSPEPGTIVVIDDEGRLRESQSAYDKRVAGVVSGAGEYRPAIVLDRRASSEGRASVALVGKVFCKVDADPAPIAVGDLLTTSARPGFGMKATDSAQAFGAVIGKALRPLRAGQGLIPILVALQ